jgi:hypothetical protein
MAVNGEIAEILKYILVRAYYLRKYLVRKYLKFLNLFGFNLKIRERFF